MQLPPNAVLFDCDGVLVDSETITNTVMRDSLANYGLNLTLHEVMGLFVGGTIQSCYEQAKKLGAGLPDDWVQNIYGEMYERLAEEVTPIPGAIEVLDRLDAAGVPYAVGSNGPHVKMNITLAKTGLKDRLEGRVVSREDVAQPKPAPDIYLRAAQLMGEPVERCIVIEDSVSGVKAGKAAGMVTWGFTAETSEEALAPISDATFSSMAELPALLKV
ncbi:MAG: HAD family phosphatase [Pseudomonadota bacterium]